MGSCYSPSVNNLRECLISAWGKKIPACNQDPSVRVWEAVGKGWKYVVEGWELGDGGMGSVVSPCNLVQDWAHHGPWGN